MSAGFAIDLGSSVTRVATSAGELLFEEPSLAAVDLSNGRLIAFGKEAAGLGARSAGQVGVVQPVRAGKLLDVEVAEAVVGEVFRRIGVGRMDRREVALCIHVDTSDVQRRALERALHQAGARHIHVVEQPVAAAIGAGLPLAEPVGTMVVDVGGGTSDLGVMALGGLVTSAAVSIGGTTFDEALRLRLLRSYGLAVSARAAEALRRRHGTLVRSDARGSVEIAGRDAMDGRPRSIVIQLEEIGAVLDAAVQPLLSAAAACIGEAPPDLANDLLRSGLLLVGGGSFLPGLDQLLAFATGVPVHIPVEADRLVVRGAARCLRRDFQPRTEFSELTFD
jgi:rod shape-determining protein MreB